jgi:hypothetical protein
MLSSNSSLLQAEYRARLQVLPDGLQEGVTAEALQAIDDNTANALA